MRVLVQRVNWARVRVGARCCAEINQGLLVLVGVGAEDTDADADALAKKTIALRIFADEAGKMNRSVVDIGGQVLSVSQFTLYADTRRGNRPGFERAAAAAQARLLWERFNAATAANGCPVQCGIFGADMSVESCNDGPVTIILDSARKGSDGGASG
ncbi:MAG: D-aminoacyl-tRNA deacylase [Candidatus Omnitrophica bacterium]|nr:D-aminoacyl-tRNA deacylase [Candidatus Omnitrophota bacterium]